MNKRFVLTDIHGCYQTFHYLMEEILQPDKNDNIYLLGDYINKGPMSKEVVDYIINLKSGGYKIHILRGNHEQVLLDAIETGETFDFYDKGGMFTLQSFGINSVHNFSDTYLGFFKSTEFYFELEDFLLVHAGFNFSNGKAFSDREAMMNYREMKVHAADTRGRKVIHGHIPTALKQVMEGFKLKDNLDIHLDTGCVYPHRKGMGFLSAIELNEFKIYVKECIDKVST